MKLKARSIGRVVVLVVMVSMCTGWFATKGWAEEVQPVSVPVEETLSTNVLVETGNTASMENVEADSISFELDTGARVALAKVAEAKIALYPELRKMDYTPFVLGDVRAERDGRWVLLTLVSEPTKPEKDTDAVMIEFYSALAEKTEGNGWLVYIENEAEYIDKMAKVPDTFLSADTRQQYIYSAYNSKRSREMMADPTDQYHIPGLPWAANEAWRYNAGPSYGTHYGQALDFGTPARNQPAMVRAAEDGKIVSKGSSPSTSTCLYIKRYNSDLQLFYQHINHDDISRWNIGDTVRLGDSLGMTTINSGCGGGSSGQHVHIAMVGVGLQQKSFNGWVITGENLQKVAENGIITTVSPNSTDLVQYGDWVITKQILFPGRATFPQGINPAVDIVLMKYPGSLDDAILLVDSPDPNSQAFIDVDFARAKLLVKGGSKLAIKAGEKIN